jgi:hypothetical protein
MPFIHNNVLPWRLSSDEPVDCTRFGVWLTMRCYPIKLVSRSDGSVAHGGTDGSQTRRWRKADSNSWSPCRQSAISHIPPVAHDARCAGKHRRLAGPDEDAGNDELPEAPDQSSRRLGERPDEQAEAQQAARTNAVRQRPARKLAESVRPEERRNGGGSGWYIRADADWGWILGRRAAMDFR